MEKSDGRWERLAKHNLEWAEFVVEEKGGKTILGVGSHDDGHYNWELDISSLSPEEMKVVRKLERMVKEQGGHDV